MWQLLSRLPTRSNPSAARGESVALSASRRMQTAFSLFRSVKKQAGHEFDEAVYGNGIVRWQSQPAQGLASPMIQALIQHD